MRLPINNPTSAPGVTELPAEVSRGCVQRVVQPHPVEYRSRDVTDRAHATQLHIKDDVIGLYWHLNPGYQRTGGKKIHATENAAKLAVLDAAIKKTKAKLASLKAEVVRLNREVRRGGPDGSK